MKYYMAYGSNLNLTQMGERCPSSVLVNRAVLVGYTLMFKGDGCGYLTIEKADRGIVPVGIFKVNRLDELSLDFYEGYPLLYRKENMKILNKNVFVYIMNDWVDYCLPSVHYIAICRDGYRDMGFNNKFLIEALANTERKIKKKVRYLN